VPAAGVGGELLKAMQKSLKQVLVWVEGKKELNREDRVEGQGDKRGTCVKRKGIQKEQKEKRRAKGPGNSDTICCGQMFEKRIDKKTERMYESPIRGREPPAPKISCNLKGPRRGTGKGKTDTRGSRTCAQKNRSKKVLDEVGKLLWVNREGKECRCQKLRVDAPPKKSQDRPKGQRYKKEKARNA